MSLSLRALATRTSWPTLLEHPARPRRVGSGLYGYTQRLLGGEAPSEGLRGCAQPPFLDHLAAVLVDEAQSKSTCRRDPTRLSSSVALCYHPLRADPPLWAVRARQTLQT